MTAEEKKIIQGVIDNVHQQFVQAVAKGENWTKKR